MNKEIVSSVADAIDWKIIDQLHSATLNFSNKSLEIKKMYILVLGIAVPVIVNFAANKLDISLFVTLYLITLIFWFLDSFTYYYQEKLRVKMDTHFKMIKDRHNQVSVQNLSTAESYTIDILRYKAPRLFRSAFNNSHWFYYILILLIALSNILFWFRIIK